MFSRLFNRSGLLRGGILLGGIVAGAVQCNDEGLVGGGEALPLHERLGDACGPTILSAQVQPDQRTLLRLPAGHPLAGAWVDIPAGSVSTETTVELSAGTRLTLESGQEALGDSLCVLPHTQSFAKPISIVLPYRLDRAQQLGLAPEQLAMATQKLYDLTPASAARGLQPRAQRVPLGIGAPAQIVAGMFAVDTQQGLLGVEVRQAGIYQVISRGMRSPASEPHLDILHVLDNSGSMSPKQNMVARLLPRFFDQVSRRGSTLFDKCVDWHLGAITTDVRHDPKNPGDDGRLRQTFCDPSTLSPDAQAACKALKCDTVPALKQPFIAPDPTLTYDQQSRQYQCLMLVGDQGSSQERPLHALSRFIEREKQTRVMTPAQSFFRDSGIALFMFLTDENDCSVRPDRVAEFDRAYTPGCTTHSPECYTPNFRCYAMALECDGRSDFHTLGRYERCIETPRGLMKSTQLFAEELYNFVVGPPTLGNLGRDKDFGSVMLRAIVPMATDMKDSRLIEVGTDKIPEFMVSFEHADPGSPPTSDPNTAFCSRFDGTNHIIGNVQNRVSNFVLRYEKLRDIKGTVDDPRVEIRSICDEETSLAKSLDVLAKDLINNKDVACEKALTP